MGQILTSDRQDAEGYKARKIPLFLTSWDGLESEFTLTPCIRMS